MKIDRLIGILSILLQKDVVTAPYLAERFEVSRRTINRDIDDLCQAGIPIMTRQGMNGGISIMKDYKMERTLLTNAEMQDILAGLRSLDSINGTNRYGQLMEKLSVGSSDFMTGNQSVLIDLSSWYKDSLAPKIELIRNAIDSCLELSFRYYSPQGESQRTAQPYDLIFRWSSWYLWAWCRVRRDWRLFKLGRMLDVSVLEEVFPPRPVPPVPFAHLAFPDELEAAVRFDPAAKWKLVDEYGAECFTREPDGSLLFRRSFPGRGELLRWVLSFGDQAEILEPEDMRREMADFAKKIFEKYDS